MSVCINYEDLKKTHMPVNKTLCVDEQVLESVQNSSTKNIPIESLLPMTLNYLILWRNRIKQRRALARLDQRMLNDIGYTIKEAREEYTKPFWK